MTETILVTYASRTGSTEGIAQEIARCLIQAGAQVHVLPVHDVHDVAPYAAVVAGSAIQGGQWLPEALHFVETHRAALAHKPFAAFLVCMTLAMNKGDHRAHVANWMAPIRARVRPVSEGLFPGTLDVSEIRSFGDRLKFRISVMMGIWSEGDHRDWEAVRTWAEGLRPLLLR